MTLEGVAVHRLGLCESDDVGPGTRIWAFAHVMQGAVVGRNCNVGGGAFVESGVRVGDGVTIKNNVLLWDGVTLEDDVFVGPNAVFTNDPQPRAKAWRMFVTPTPTLVQRGATIGANATVMCGLTIGPHAMVGAGAVVTRDVMAHELVVGNPAHHRGWVCACGRPVTGPRWTCQCGQAHTAIGSGLVRVPAGMAGPDDAGGPGRNSVAVHHRKK